MKISAIILVATFAATAGAARAGAYDAVSIVAPKQNQSLFSNNGDVAVEIKVSPPLRAADGDRIAVLLDGKAVASGAGASIALSGVNRGTHMLQAQVISQGGAVLAASAPVSFQLWHASRLFPNRRQ